MVLEEKIKVEEIINSGTKYRFPINLVNRNFLNIEMDSQRLLAQIQPETSKSWVLSSFDTNLEPSTSSMKINNTQKRYALKKRKLEKFDLDCPWIEKFTPNSKDELGVHKKKILDVETWLMDKTACQYARILLLTGPTGAGKTATIKVLCKQLKLEIIEWTNSMQQTAIKSLYSYGSIYNEISSGLYEDQVSKFNNFLLRSNKYSLFTDNHKKVILIEELPNVFLRDPSSFHDSLRKFNTRSYCRVIFIISDNSRGESLENVLFPKHLQQELGIYNICFNPMAPTFLIKVLTKIYEDIKNEYPHFRLTREELEGLAADSLGDIRNAINSLQFLSTSKFTTSLPKVEGKNAQGMAKSSRRRDNALFLFHALGKILYCKRKLNEMPDCEILPEHLKQYERYPLLSNPEDIFDRTAISADGFSLFLHQNLAPFVTDIKVASNCLFWMSEADVLTHEWAEREVMNTYSSSLVARGLMFNFVSPNKGNCFRSFNKPLYYDIFKKHREMKERLKLLFQDKHLLLQELITEMIPYISKIGNSGYTQEQILFIKQIAEIPLIYTYSGIPFKKLSEKDGFLEEQDNSLTALQNSIQQETSHKYEEYFDEEYVIEEYD